MINFMNRPFDKEQAAQIAFSVLANRGSEPSNDIFVTFRHYRLGDFGFEGWAEGYHPKGGATFCIVADPVSEVLHVAVAECSDKDLYNRQVGRAIAFGRFVKGAFTTLPWGREAPISRSIECAFEDMGVRNSHELVISGKFY